MRAHALTRFDDLAPVRGNSSLDVFLIFEILRLGEVLLEIVEGIFVAVVETRLLVFELLPLSGRFAKAVFFFCQDLKLFQTLSVPTGR